MLVGDVMSKMSEPSALGAVAVSAAETALFVNCKEWTPIVLLK
jgi:hypothetical protein